jgi:CBS domain-containing protein
MASTTGWFRTAWPRGIVEHVADVLAERARATRTCKLAHAIPITEIMTRNVVCARPDLDVATLIDVILRDHLGCMPVVDDFGHPVGMVTKLDIVEFLAAARDPDGLTAADVMMPLAITIEHTTTVAHAAALMAIEEMHHVMIVSGRRLVGLVSTMDVTRWLALNEARD